MELVKSANQPMQVLLVLVLVFAGIGAGDAQETKSAKKTNSGVAAASVLPAETNSIPPKKTSIDKLPPDADYVIGPDDVLNVNVWEEPEFSQTVPVRPDGKISLPLVGDVVASGLTPKQLEASIKAPLGNFVSSPAVTVIVHEVKSRRVTVAGQVAKPGSYVLQTPMTALDAIAQAGGPLEYAKLKSIYVLRTGSTGQPIRLRFNYKDVINGRNLSQNVQLEPHDTVVVP
jgi:polysaccharide export outer membrane protein